MDETVADMRRRSRSDAPMPFRRRDAQTSAIRPPGGGIGAVPSYSSLASHGSGSGPDDNDLMAREVQSSGLMWNAIADPIGERNRSQSMRLNQHELRHDLDAGSISPHLEEIYASHGAAFSTEEGFYQANLPGGFNAFAGIN